MNVQHSKVMIQGNGDEEKGTPAPNCLSQGTDINLDSSSIVGH